MITVEMVRNAYAETGLRPTRNEFFHPADEPNKPDKACAIATLVVSKRPHAAEYHRYVHWFDEASKLLDVSGSYLRGFVAGFDNKFSVDTAREFAEESRRSRGDQAADDYLRGYENGVQVAEALAPF